LQEWFYFCVAGSNKVVIIDVTLLLGRPGILPALLDAALILLGCLWIKWLLSLGG